MTTPETRCGRIMPRTYPPGRFVCAEPRGHSGPHSVVTLDGHGGAVVMWTDDDRPAFETDAPAPPTTGEADYDGDPPFFTPSGDGVSLEYVGAVRAELGLRPGQSLLAAIRALRSSPGADVALREAAMDVYDEMGPRDDRGKVVEPSAFAALTGREVDALWDFSHRHMMHNLARALSRVPPSVAANGGA